MLFTYSKSIAFIRLLNGGSSRNGHFAQKADEGYFIFDGPPVDSRPVSRYGCVGFCVSGG